MSKKPESENDEARFGKLLRQLDAAAPPPDAAALQALRQRTIEVFLNSTEPNAPSDALSSLSPRSPRRNPMFAVVVRAAIAVSAVLALLLARIGFEGVSAVHAAPAFSSVLAELRKAKTLHLEIVKGDEKTQVWVRSPGLVRREHSPERYDIAAGSRFWEIDELTNTVTEKDSPWFVSPQQHVDLLKLLELEVKDATLLLRSTPDEEIKRDGHEYLVYRAPLSTRLENVEVEAWVEKKNLRLSDLIARPAGVQPAPKRPLAELRLVAMNAAIADEKFVVTKSLTEDGRIGKISESQGIVLLRPMLAKRWTPVCREMLLKPGDWVRTELRGANATKITLSSQAELTLGPGSLVECIAPNKARLHNGQAQVMLPKQNEDEKSTFTLLAPRAGEKTFEGGEKQLVRANREEKLVDVPQTPLWLAGFEGTSSNESLGSLIVQLPDGRNEPLTVGYHKVKVEIRDQIARTTIEESFVNHTDSRLEGVFHFPLPQDASISGFGMWIGNDLIEADVVEKQRAREIYETILREKRDPGLLEWTVGNIFKARVFPIEARSEKRVKIVYTQVLPMRGNRYRYSYGLRSEMLRTKPLRELSLQVTLNSAVPLKSVTCPTHSARLQQTDHSGQVDFSAQEYTPSRDFEVVCEIDGRQSDVVVIPHRRGDDGYLLVQLMPPSPDGNWQREVLPEGQPLQVVLLCDTSGSMDAEKRKQQAEFVAAILSSLGVDDRFMLAAADVGTAWAFAEPVVANADNIAKAETFLQNRLSLGWTNLDRAFEDTIKKAPANAQVVYVGDGIVSSGDTDATSFVKRLGLLLGGDKEKGKRTFHAVAVGNATEAVALKGIAAMGGGSVRTIGGEQTPQSVAFELLNEVAQPGLRDLQVEFRNVKVAAVYPERLPNVPAGTQQILVGRYLPEGKDQVGEVVVTGLRGTEKVRYAAKIHFKDAEAGNSFIPRLWARGHLDHLLAQGSSSAIRDEIISLSEQFHIITPYTSLLVLETDADRERFGVKRRYEMRDGEKFFAAGKGNANFELLHAQMKRAGEWHTGLRRKTIASLAGLGRNSQAFQQRMQGQRPRIFNTSGVENFWGFTGSGLSPKSGFSSGSGRMNINLFSESTLAADGGFLGGFGGGGGGEFGLPMPALASPVAAEDGYFDLYSRSDSGGALRLGLGEQSEMLGEELSNADTWSGEYNSDGLKDEVGIGIPLDAEAQSFEFGRDLYDDDKPLSFRGELAATSLRTFEPFGRESNRRWNNVDWFEGRRGVAVRNASLELMDAVHFQGLEEASAATSITSNYRLIGLFPSVGERPGKGRPAPKSPANWTPEAVALAKSLLRTDSLQKMSGGIELRRTADSWDPYWKRRSYRNRDFVLYSTTAWLARPLESQDETVIHFCDKKERGAFTLTFLLGTIRESAPVELAAPPLGLQDGSLTPIYENLSKHTARVEPADGGKVRLIVTTPDGSVVERYTIDTERHVLVKYEHVAEGVVTETWTFDDFVQVAGSWWTKKVTVADEKGRTTGETQLEIVAHSAAEYAKRMETELAAKSTVQFAKLPFVKLKVARQKVADGSAGFDDRLTMTRHYVSRQLWDDMWPQVDAIEKLANNKPGVRWLRTQLLANSRRFDEARKQLRDESQKIASAAQPDDAFTAEFILDRVNDWTSAGELLEFVNLLKPVYERQPADSDAMSKWQRHWATCQVQLGRREEVYALYQKMADAHPWDAQWRDAYVALAESSRRLELAISFLEKELARPVERDPADDESLRDKYVELLKARGRWSEMLKFTTAWVARTPETAAFNSVYLKHLEALIYNDQLDASYKLADEWLQAARVDGKLTRGQKARYDAAVHLAMGSGSNIFNRMEERWFEPIAETVRFFVRHKHHWELASVPFQNSNFQQSDVCDRLRGEMLLMLQTELDKLAPRQVEDIVRWTLSGRIELKQQPLPAGRKQLDASEIPNATWQAIVANVKRRWQAAEKKVDKHALGEAVRQIHASRFSESELLPFLRERVSAEDIAYKAENTTALFDALLAAKWTASLEQEAFARLRDLADEDSEAKKSPAERLRVQLPALYRLVDAMLANRERAAEQALRDKGELEKLTRKELAAKKADLRKTARKEFATRLAAEADKEKQELAPWLRIEQTWLDTQLEQNLAKVEAFCWQVLGNAPPNQNIDPDEENENRSNDEALQRMIDAQLKRRAFTTVLHLAARRDAKPASVTRIDKYIDAGIEHGGETAETWRNAKFQLLVVLDRADDLERELRAWIRSDVTTAPWRQMLARLVAERGKLDEAIRLFEAAEKHKLLTAADYRTLADWRLAANDRAGYERAKIEAIKQAHEYQLSNMLRHIGNRWMRTDIPLPSELDENTLLTFRALFEKSANPEHYLYQLRELYGACRDFRLLQMVPDAVLGRTPQQIYSFLLQLEGQLLHELRNEATADEILARVKKLREGERTETDLRALDLLEALVERKSAEVLNQPGPHVDACLAALQRAFQRKWGDGEPQQMASFLRHLGTFRQSQLVEEQIRELRELQKQAKPNSREHLTITNELCNVLVWNYHRTNEGIREMEVEVRSYEQGHNGKWPTEDHEILRSYVSMYEGANRHAAGEAVLTKYLANPENDEQVKWLRDRLVALYNHALEWDPLESTCRHASLSIL